MTSVTELQLTNFRNFCEAKASPSSGINLIYGENGSGKTSLLEAIHLLSTGKSFRSSLVDPLIKDGEKAATIFAATEDQNKVGLTKPRNQKQQLRLNEENQKSWDQGARILPSQVLDATSFDLLEGGPKARRRFMDWGVFHVEPSFLDNWRRASKSIANRNRLLKQGQKSSAESAQINAWDRELCLAASAIDESRTRYLERLLPAFQTIYEKLVGNHPTDLHIIYKRGWSSDLTLDEALASNKEVDFRYGSTQAGPHRADLDIKLGSRRAQEILSRGQEKLVVCALKVAQGEVLSQAVDRKCIYLIDDLPAELDPSNREKVMQQLVQTSAQLFITSVEATAIDTDSLGRSDIAKFHVERGILTG